MQIHSVSLNPALGKHAPKPHNPTLMTPTIHTHLLADEAATAALAQQLASTLHFPQTIWLQGNLGAGKTTFVRHLLHALGHTGKVKSPTYSLVESYLIGKHPCHHFDLYRFADPEEWHDAGLTELFDAHSLCLIEWPQNGGKLTPPPDLSIHLTPHQNGRLCELQAHTPSGQESLASWI